MCVYIYVRRLCATHLHTALFGVQNGVRLVALRVNRVLSQRQNAHHAARHAQPAAQHRTEKKNQTKCPPRHFSVDLLRTEKRMRKESGVQWCRAASYRARVFMVPSTAADPDL